MKEKILMHQDIETAKVLQYENGIEILEVINKEHLPVGTYNDYTPIMNKLASIWFNDRVIPDDRQNIDSIINKLGTAISDAYVKSLGVSITDCYWFKEEGANLSWEDVNFYDNGFEENHFCSEFSFLHPDLTTNGALEKTWKSIDNIPYLLKKEKNNVLTVNEVVVSEIAGRLGLKCTPYHMCKINSELWSICPDIITNNSTEMVSVLQIGHENIQNPAYALTFLNNNFQKEFKDMLFLHCLTHNTDGHEKNIAVIRDAKTLEYLNLASPFDNGTCLGSYLLDADGSINKNITKNDEMKDLFSNRREILDYIGNDILNYSLPSFAEMENIIKKHYESNSISPSVFSIASEELKRGYESIINKQLYIKKEMDEWER